MSRVGYLLLLLFLDNYKNTLPIMCADVLSIELNTISFSILISICGTIQRRSQPRITLIGMKSIQFSFASGIFFKTLWKSDPVLVLLIPSIICYNYIVPCELCGYVFEYTVIFLNVCFEMLTEDQLLNQTCIDNYQKSTLTNYHT